MMKCGQRNLSLHIYSSLSKDGQGIRDHTLKEDIKQ